MRNRLKVLRAERDWSQAELAERLSVSRQTVNAIENERYDPSLPLAFAIARLFAVRILQCDEGQLQPIPVQKRLAVGEVGVSEVEGADGRESAALERLIKQEPRQLFVFAELPDQPPGGLRQRLEPPLPELPPGNRVLTGQRVAEVRARSADLSTTARSSARSIGF